MAFEVHAEGTLTADGSEQIVAEIEEAARFSGYLSLSGMGIDNTATSFGVK